ncbi:GNAT family N-acetyltransferase [Microbacterium sp. 2C]|uniref:GNAT family N-acetyltransferase n=1 Tax=Microbacterium paulum TaxID=2707006 RepID=UPI0018C34907|nr:GNAT family N-acetyltransferase [Microbacterium paulum]MBG0716797.1 GNAT family N-acetyltransferase [Microbacterium paulum]
MAEVTVRAARSDDAAAAARVHVEGWRETYRGLVDDDILDDASLLPRRERFWASALGGDPRYADVQAAVAEVDGEIVGIAMSRAADPYEEDASVEVNLTVLYVLQAHHGTGLGAALLDAVVRPDGTASLWVADPNPRAQAFYRKHRFDFDGAGRVESGVRELRMARTGQ